MLALPLTYLFSNIIVIFSDNLLRLFQAFTSRAHRSKTSRSAFPLYWLGASTLTLFSTLSRFHCFPFFLFSSSLPFLLSSSLSFLLCFFLSLGALEDNEEVEKGEVDEHEDDDKFVEDDDKDEEEGGEEEEFDLFLWACEEDLGDGSSGAELGAFLPPS